MNKLRREIRDLIDATPCRRPPALRRSLRDDFLYATDLPQAAEESAVRDFCRRAEEAGWRTEAGNGWIQMDTGRAEPGGAGFRGPYGTEAQACAGILRRHPGNRRDGTREKRLLAKAGEEGPAAFEKACTALHREFAAALRLGEQLPDLPEQYFTGGGET